MNDILKIQQFGKETMYVFLIFGLKSLKKHVVMFFDITSYLFFLNCGRLNIQIKKETIVM